MWKRLFTLLRCVYYGFYYVASYKPKFLWVFWHEWSQMIIILVSVWRLFYSQLPLQYSKWTQTDPRGLALSYKSGYILAFNNFIITRFKSTIFFLARMYGFSTRFAMNSWIGSRIICCSNAIREVVEVSLVIFCSTNQSAFCVFKSCYRNRFRSWCRVKIFYLFYRIQKEKSNYFKLIFN